VTRETPYFTDRERAALAFTEAVTLLARSHAPRRPAAQFTGDEIAALVSLITAINAWSAIAVSTRAWSPAPTSREACPEQTMVGV